MQPHWGTGLGGGSALPSPGSRGMRVGMAVGRGPTPGRLTPALPLGPAISRASSSYFCLSARSYSGVPSFRKPSGTPRPSVVSYPPSRLSYGFLQSSAPPLHTLHHLGIRVPSLLVSLHGELLGGRGHVGSLPCVQTQHTIGSGHFQRRQGICWSWAEGQTIFRLVFLGTGMRLLLSLRPQIHFLPGEGT